MSERCGSFKAATICGVPVFVHWSSLIGGLLFSGYAGSRPIELIYYCIASVLVVAIHEFGHFAAARSLGLTVFSVLISGIDGECMMQERRSVRETLFVSSAGLLAQGLLLLLTLSFVTIFGLPTDPFGRCLVTTFTYYNGLIFLINAIPWRTRTGLSSDGRVLWQVAISTLENQLTTSHSKSGIYLIRFSLPQEHQWGFQWSLTNIKPNTTEGSLEPYLAFASNTAAAEFIASRGNGDRLSVVEASQLDLSTYFLHASGALVFRSLAELNSCLSNPAAGGGQWRPLPSASRFSDFVRALKDWRVKRATRHLPP